MFFLFSIENNDKENNANSQNMTANVTPPTLIEASPLSFGHEYSNQPTLTELTSLSMRFDPNEITARSSSMSPHPKIQNTSSSSSTTTIEATVTASASTVTENFQSDNFSFNSAAAELISKFSNDDFLSGSRLHSQLDADQRSYVNNYNPIPLLENTKDKDRMEFSCFSGVMGDLDLSVESCAGRKISVGEFFKRKCDAIGQLNDGKNDRPNFGLKITSPKRPTRNNPLINLTTMSADMASASINKSCASTMDCTRDQDQDVISLSRIARALENTSGTPRNLVDQLLMLKKIQKEQKYSINYNYNDNNNNQGKQEAAAAANCTVGTYTIASKRSSMPAPLTMSLDNTHKLSLASATTLENRKSSSSFNSSNITKHPILFENTIDISAAAAADADNSTLIDNIKTSESMKNKYQQNNFTPEQKYLKITKKEIESPVLNGVKPEINLSQNKMENRLNDKLIIGRNVQGLYRCIVGVAKDVDIKMLNESDRWFICTCNVFSIQGDQTNVELDVPKFTMIIEPSKSQTVKVKVKMIKMGNPVMAALNISVKDMTTRDEFTKTHMMCFIPEEPIIQVIQPLTNELNFNASKIYTIELKNQFDSDVPIECFIVNDERRQFTIDINNKLIEKTYSNGNETFYVSMIPLNGKFFINIQLNHRLSNNLRNKIPILVIRLHNDLQNGTIIKQYLLRVDDLFSSRSEIELIDTELPIILSSSNKRESKKLMIKNNKKQLLILSASVLISKDSDRINNNYSIDPKRIELEPGQVIGFSITFRGPDTINTDRHGILRIKSDEYSYWYPVNTEYDSTMNENFMRCDTPQQQLVQALSSPSSPHSTVSNKSGKNSPRSSVSGLTVAGDTIPIQATHSSLTWISIRVGKYEIKEFTIRNTSQNRIKLQAIIIDNDKCFKFLKDRESSTSITLVLQRMESKTLTIIFSPNNIGPAVGKITFKHYETIKKIDETLRSPSRLISLYGYGGYARVSISQALKIMGDQMWLSLGKLNDYGVLSTRIQLENTGDLSAYAKINLSPKAVYPGMETSWNIEPTEVILGPKESRWIKIDFRPKKDDLMLLKGDVSDMGILTITHGDEPTRWRIRRLYKKLNDAGQMNNNNNNNKKDDDVFRNVVRPICKALPGEMSSIHNLTLIRDNVSELGILCRGVNRHVITLMMELNTDDITLSMLNDDANESQTFQSLCSDTSHNYIFPTSNEDSYMPLETIILYEDNEFTVTPSLIIINQLSSNNSTFIIKSLSNIAQPFEIKLSHPELLNINPAGGMIPSKTNIPIKIECKKILDRNVDVKVQIFTTNEEKNVTVRLISCSTTTTTTTRR